MSKITKIIISLSIVALSIAAGAAFITLTDDSSEQAADRSTQSTKATETVNESEEPNALEESDKELENPAPLFELELHSGETYDLASVRGEKPIVLDFWASWCHNCQRDMPKLSVLHQKYEGRVEVIGVNMLNNDSRGEAEAFVERLDLEFPIVYDASGSTARAYGVQYTSTKVFINSRGEIIETTFSDVTEADFENLLAS